jgi:hypothetical protein
LVGHIPSCIANLDTCESLTKSDITHGREALGVQHNGVILTGHRIWPAALFDVFSLGVCSLLGGGRLCGATEQCKTDGAGKSSGEKLFLPKEMTESHVPAPTNSPIS